MAACGGTVHGQALATLEPRTLQENRRPSRCASWTSPRSAVSSFRLMGGMAIRAHAPDWPARPGARGRPRLRHPLLRSLGPFYPAARSRRAIRPSDSETRSSRGSRRTSSTSPGGTGRWTSSSNSRSRWLPPARIFPDRLVLSRARPSRSAELLLSKLQVSSRSTARTSSTRSSCSPSIRWGPDDGAADSRHGLGATNAPDPLVHLE